MDSNEIKKLQSFGDKPFTIDLSKLTENCKNVDQYKKIKRIGEGTYGVVYKAIDKEDKVVALKKMRFDDCKHGIPISTIREIKILSATQNENIVKLNEIVIGKFNSIFLVMEYCENDLATLLDNMQQPFNESQIKCVMLQVFKGLSYLHLKYQCHRDIKLSNLLINSKGQIKIADFGLARKFGYPLKEMTPNVVTLWYRAPELLLNSKYQTTAIDMWATGCVLASLLKNKPIFQSNSEIQQLNQIIELLGTPNDQIWPGVLDLPFFQTFTLKDQPYNNIKERFKFLSESGIKLINNLFTYDPKKRITADQALESKYFKEKPYPCKNEMMPNFPDNRSP